MLAALSITFFSTVVFATPNYPKQPDAELTPGAVCTTPDRYRYASRIPYCERDVDSNLKWVVIMKYMKKFNFVIDSSNRDQFKIDHFIPLCMGGANSIDNLWPQHKSVFSRTDDLELALCQKLSEGRLTQTQAIQKIKTAKLNLQLIPSLIKEANQLR